MTEMGYPYTSDGFKRFASRVSSWFPEIGTDYLRDVMTTLKNNSLGDICESNRTWVYVI